MLCTQVGGLPLHPDTATAAGAAVSASTNSAGLLHLPLSPAQAAAVMRQAQHRQQQDQEHEQTSDETAAGAGGAMDDADRGETPAKRQALSVPQQGQAPQLQVQVGGADVASVMAAAAVEDKVEHVADPLIWARAQQEVVLPGQQHVPGQQQLPAQQHVTGLIGEQQNVIISGGGGGGEVQAPEDTITVVVVPADPR